MERRIPVETVFWSCLAFGALIALVTIVFGDFLGDLTGGAFHWLSADVHHLFHPVVLAGGITVFGGTGTMLIRYSSLHAGAIYACSGLVAVTVGVLLNFLYVRPMEHQENSVAFSINDLAGRIGEVLVPIPSGGYGEVMVRIGAGNTNQIAASFDGVPIEAGAEVVIVDVKDGELLVSRLDWNTNRGGIS